MIISSTVRRLLGLVSIPALLAGGASVCHAQTLQNASFVPRTGFFGGAGLGINGVNMGKQSIYAIGISHNYSDADGSLASAGSAWGPGAFTPATPVTVSPQVQFGYYRHFGGSPWLWGVKLGYANLEAETDTSNVGIPQAGFIAYTSTHTVQPFTGVAVVDNYRTKANHQFSLMPFIGHSYGRGFVYFGAGATATHTETDMDGLVGYAFVNGQVTNVSGAPQNFSSAGWVMGVGLELGTTYFITPHWFLDVSYNFNETAPQVGNYYSTFVNATTNPGITTKGSLIGRTSERVMTNSLQLTFNRSF